MIFAGRAPDADLHAWYEAASLFVHPTRYEGSSLVTLEAMAHRKPIVATRAGGLPDKVRPGENGWLVEPGDADGLAQALARGGLARRRDSPPWARAAARSSSASSRGRSLADQTIALYRELRRAEQGDRLARANNMG